MDSCSEIKKPVADRRKVFDPFSYYSNIRITNVYEDGSVDGELQITPKSLNVHGFVHGGCLATLADTVAGHAAHLYGKCVTLNYAFNFLRPAKGENEKIRCLATPEKVGRTLCVYHLSLTDDAGVEIASGSFTFFLLKKWDKPLLPNLEQKK